MANKVPEKKSHGPRSRVFAHLSRYADSADTLGWTGKTVNQDGTTSPLPSNDSVLKSLDTGNMQLYSYFSPGLPEGLYTAKVTHKISSSQAGNTETPLSSKSFSVIGPNFAVDPKVVNSVYPPAAHADYASVLPSIVFSDPHYPWLVDMGEPQDLPDGMKMPWLALLVFTESEITPSAEQIKSIQQRLLSAGSSTKLDQNPKSKSFSLKLSDLVSMDPFISQPVQPSESARNDSTPLDVVLVSSTIFDGVFGDCSSKGGQSEPPNLIRFAYMSHVKNVNVTELPGNRNVDADVGQFSVTVSPRTGPLDLEKDTTLYVHLVSLVNVAENIKIPSGKDEGVAALISLYSWSYTCIPPEKVSVYDTLRNLGESVQPFRTPDSLRHKSPDEAMPELMVHERMDAGYSLIKYRLRTGEETMAFQRGPLSPTAMPHPMGGYPQQSNFGTDLIILDKDLGILNLTYQLAWQLGRAIAMSDRVFVAALLRIRAAVHEKALAEAKISQDTTFMKREDVLKSFSDIIVSLKDAQETQRPGNNLQGHGFSLRWQKSGLRQRSLRSRLAFRSENVRRAYIKNVPKIVRQHAQSTGPSTGSLYNEWNSPDSPSYAVILEWCLDRLFLHGIPYHYIVPNGLFVPKESIRTFYVDDNWLDVFLDGALSLGNYYARETDVIRSSIKEAINDYLKTNLSNGHPPPIPRWGFIMRSEIVAKFPDLVISAPWPDPQDTRLEVLKIEKPDSDMLLCLFDRVPEDGYFKNGITFIPPEHQTSFELGVSITPETLQMEWKRVYPAPDCKKDYTKSLPVQSYSAPNDIFDFSTRCLIFPDFIVEAISMQYQVSTNADLPYSGHTSVMAGVQLIADTPKLLLADSDNVSHDYKPLPPRQIYIGTVAPVGGSKTLPERPSYASEERTTTAETNGKDSSAMHREDKKHRGLAGNSGTHSHTLGLDHMENLRQTHHHSSEASPGKSAVQSTPFSTATVAGDVDTQMECTFICGALACGYTIPVISKLKPPPLLSPNFDGPVTRKWSSQLPPFVDQGFSIIAKTEVRGWCLEYVEVTIPVGNRDTDLLSPFSTGEKQLRMAVTNTTSSGMASTDALELSCPAAKPQTSFNEWEIPKVIPFSRARRFLPSVNYFPDPAVPDCGQMVVRMRPVSSEVSDLMDSYDASFTIRQPQINWKKGTKYTVKIAEKYQSSAGTPGTFYAYSTVDILACYAHEDTNGMVQISC